MEINPQRRYYIKTKGGRVLVRNHRFLRQRLPTAIPETTLPSSQALPLYQWQIQGVSRFPQKPPLK